MKYLSSVLFIILTGSASLSANTNTIIAEEPLTAPVTSPAYTVTGTITDKTGEPLPGVTVRIRRKPAQAESTVHMLNWAIRSVKFLGVEFD